MIQIELAGLRLFNWRSGIELMHEDEESAEASFVEWRVEKIFEVRPVYGLVFLSQPSQDGDANSKKLITCTIVTWF